MIVKFFLEDPADFLNPYWYEKLGGINWSEKGETLTMQHKGRPIWNPNFKPSLFLNHGIKKIHILLNPSEQNENIQKSLEDLLRLFSEEEAVETENESLFKISSFSTLQQRLEKRTWIPLLEGKGISIFFKKEVSKTATQKIVDLAKEKKWILTSVEKLYDLP
jgi:hypothetical protein